MSETADKYRWETQPAAWALVHTIVDEILSQEPALAVFADRLRAETGTRLIDWIRSITLPTHSSYIASLRQTGFVEARQPDGSSTYTNPRGIFPVLRIVAQGHPVSPQGQIVLAVEDVPACIAAHDWQGQVGYVAPPAAERPVAILTLDRTEVVLRASEPAVGWHLSDYAADPLSRHRSVFQQRPRQHDDAASGFAHTSQLIAAAQAELGTDLTCELFFATEREFWQSRNGAAQTQKSRQDALGLGWANHDHHTYRSSRECFAPLIATLEQLGLRCRERFYAGREAGWGAQVLERTETGIIVFADVDLTPTEVAADFAHQPLATRQEAGTVGMWCQLHGESFLQAGMHHLECQFDFAAATQQLSEVGVETMLPFTDFPFLKQAFTVGEMWPVKESRLAKLLSQGMITAEQAERFRRDGALGSHLEILERNDAYKGFNQTGISDIIQRTDPRHAV